MDRVVSLLCIFRVGGSVLCATATRQREKKWQLERKEDVVMAQRTIFGVGMEESLWERSDGAKASTPRRLDCLYIYTVYYVYIYIYIPRTISLEDFSLATTLYAFFLVFTSPLLTYS